LAIFGQRARDHSLPLGLDEKPIAIDHQGGVAPMALGTEAPPFREADQRREHAGAARQHEIAGRRRGGLLAGREVLHHGPGRHGLESTVTSPVLDR